MGWPDEEPLSRLEVWTEVPRNDIYSMEGNVTTRRVKGWFPIQTSSLDRNTNLWPIWSSHSPPSSNKCRCALTSQIRISQCPTSHSHSKLPHGFCISDLCFRDSPVGSLHSEISGLSPPNLFPLSPPLHPFRPSTLRQPFQVSGTDLFRLLSLLSLLSLLPQALPSLLPLPPLPSRLPLPNSLPSKASLPFSHRLSLPFSLLLCLLRPTNCRISSSLFSFCFPSSLHLSLFFQNYSKPILLTLPRYRLPSHVHQYFWPSYSEPIRFPISFPPAFRPYSPLSNWLYASSLF